MSALPADGPESDALAPDAVYSSLGDVRTAHLALMRLASANETIEHAEGPEGGNIAPDAQTIRVFLDKAKRAGRSIEGESDRRAAKRILEYWSAELQTRPGTTKEDIGHARLDPFAGGRLESLEAVAADESESAASETATPSSDAFDASIEEERLRIRVAAQARQWSKTNYEGYLLRGRALEEAVELPQGPDIADFVSASIKAEQKATKSRDRTKNLVIIVFAALTAGLAVLTVYAFIQTGNANQKAVEIAALNRDLTDQVGLTTQALADAEAERARVVEALAVAVQRAEEVNKRLTDQEAAQATLRSAIVLIIRQLALGRISVDQLTPELRQAALVEVAGQVTSGVLVLSALPSQLQLALAPLLGDLPDTLPNDLPGYQADFLEAEIELPKPTGDLASDAAETPLNYVNYSLLMSQSRRIAIYSAANLERFSRVVLQTTGGRLVPDQRVPQDQQPDTAWYQPPWSAALLVSANDIAWGPQFAGDPGEASLKLARYTNVLPNSVPQLPDFNAGIWAQLENWVRTQHNSLADRVTIFTGPVFPAEDQPIEGVPIPDAYWKVAVSSVPAPAKGEVTEPEFAVDAFLIPLDTTDAEFDPSRFRISIAELEMLTGLDFGYVIGWTDTLNRPGANGATAADDLAARVGQLDSRDEGVRQVLRDELAAVLGNADLPVAERGKVVAAMVLMAATPSMVGLSRIGRLNILEALIWVPPELWRRPDWLAFWAQARRAAGDLEIRAARGDMIIGEQTRVVLDQLKQQLEIPPVSTQRVFLQFAGMRREDAEALSEQMRSLGWGIPKPGEERVEAAQGLNEVRYNPDNYADRAAAELLAADLTAAGQPVRARAVSVIRDQILEIWVSI